MRKSVRNPFRLALKYLGDVRYVCDAIQRVRWENTISYGEYVKAVDRVSELIHPHTTVSQWLVENVPEAAAIRDELHEAFCHNQKTYGGDLWGDLMLAYRRRWLEHLAKEWDDERASVGV